MLGTVLSIRDTVVNDINQSPVLTELITLWWKSQTISKSHEVRAGSVVFSAMEDVVGFRHS